MRNPDTPQYENKSLSILRYRLTTACLSINVLVLGVEMK